MKQCDAHAVKGFTLIELSIVLVIIGLIVGGVLVGRDLISSAAVRAQLSQIEKYNTSVNTFYGKYGYLPGDIPATPAAQFGFAPRGSYTGEGDGNGIIEGIWSDGFNVGMVECAGETVLLWEDLTVANLVDGSFKTASANARGSSDVSGSAIGNYLPAAKLGNGMYVYAWSNSTGSVGVVNANYFGVVSVTNIACSSNYGGLTVPSSKGITVAQAYAMDTKTDDGLPQSGRVQAIFAQSTNSYWMGQNPGTAVSGSPTTCYDNSNNGSNAMSYSISQNNGQGPNCALSFRMQSGD